MKKYLFPLVVVFLFSSSAFGQAIEPRIPEGCFSSYFGPGQAFKVTVESENGVVSVLDVPKGVFLNVVAFIDENPDKNGRLEFPMEIKGDVTIRTRREDELKSNESRSADSIMAWSPLEMSLKNVVVHLDVIE